MEQSEERRTTYRTIKPRISHVINAGNFMEIRSCNVDRRTRRGRTPNATRGRRRFYDVCSRRSDDVVSLRYACIATIDRLTRLLYFYS